MTCNECVILDGLMWCEDACRVLSGSFSRNGGHHTRSRTHHAGPVEAEYLSTTRVIVASASGKSLLDVLWSKGSKEHSTILSLGEPQSGQIPSRVKYDRPIGWLDFGRAKIFGVGQNSVAWISDPLK